MTWESVLLEKKDRLATITLNPPEKLNAFSGGMRQEIAEVVDDTFYLMNYYAGPALDEL